MRQSEKVPEELLTALATSLENESEQVILLYDSGSCEVRRARLAGLSIFPGGLRIPTPELRSTPLYMSEAHCPVWFHLLSIDAEALQVKSLNVTAYPTIASPTGGGMMTRTGPLPLADIRETAATLWLVEGQTP